MRTRFGTSPLFLRGRSRVLECNETCWGVHTSECLVRLHLAPHAPVRTHRARRRHLCRLVSSAAPPNTSKHLPTPNPAGGISPVTRDFVNPERPWPHLAPLAQATAAAGRLLLPRLPLYPAWVGLAGDGGTAVGPGGGAGVGHADVGGGREAGAGAGEADEAAGRQRQSAGVRAGPAAGAGAGAGTWLDFSGGRESVGAAVLRAADSEGFLRASGWVAGRGDGVGKEEGNGEGLVDEGAALCAVQGGQQGHGLQQGLGSCTQDSGPAAEAAGAAAGAAAELEGEARRRSTPLPSTASVRRRPGGGWRVEVGADGAVAGVEAPGEPRPVVQRCGWRGLAADITSLAAA